MNPQSLPITKQKQELIQQLNLMLRARYSLVYIVSVEEEPVEEILTIVAKKSQPLRNILRWDLARGWYDNQADKGSVMGALTRITRMPETEPSIFILKDLHFILRSPNDPRNAAIIREIKNLAQELKRSRHTLVLTSHILELPPEITEEVTVIDFPLPDLEEINLLINLLVAPENLNLTKTAREELIKAFQGLSRSRINRVLAKALATKQQINETDIDTVLQEKKETIRKTGILEFYTAAESLKNVGGLDNLKQWVRMRKDAFSDYARQYGIPNPKGVLLVGIQGTGKSLSAKTIAHEWRLPLLRLDTGRLFGGIVGQSESLVRQMIKLSEAIAPCVLWIDEIDKAFGNFTTGSDGDAGTSRRVFGSLITWMQEKTVPVFIVATANNVRILPAELLRKGRFDEIFFLNLPNFSERQEIFQVYLQKLRPSRLRDFDLPLLAKQTNHFSGAEIEQVLIDAMHIAFASVNQHGRRDFMTSDILRAINDTVPLAAIAREQIEDLKLWAAQAGARTASIDTDLTQELQQYTLKRGMNGLEPME
jgi:SpoVK/Ycf46/Vps4 family AAA+-type ATPase